LGVDDATIGKWVRDERRNAKSAGLSPDQEDAEMQENRRLKKRIAELEKEREILKRAVVFWVKESNE
jgi:transposase